MRQFKNKLSAFLRSAGMMHAADKLKYYLQKKEFRDINQQFKKDNPGFALPPDYFLYETFLLNYSDYAAQGKTDAAALITLATPLAGLDNAGKKILDWGCGPGRVIRFFPELLTAHHELFGTDYNPDYINWCRTHLPGITFSVNELTPPLPFEDEFFDFIYSISILTHLSEKNHFDWIQEIRRVLKPGGILVISTQGNAFKHKMLHQEVTQFEKGELVTRSSVKEGHRVYSAFQPERFMKVLFHGFDIIGFQAGTSGDSIHGQQDTWIVRKK